jgi:hypothetical protein
VPKKNRIFGYAGDPPLVFAYYRYHISICTHLEQQKQQSKMQKTSTLLASLVIMATLAFVAILSCPDGVNNVSKNKGDWTHINLRHTQNLLVRLFRVETAASVSVLDCLLNGSISRQTRLC